MTNPHAAPCLALSVRQPWAWLIVTGHKPLENRDWWTRYRGELSIHAAKTFDAAGYEWVRRAFPEIAMPSRFDVGGIVGRVRLVDCVERHSSPWFVGRYGFVLEDAEALPLRACRGMPGFFRPEFPP